MLNLYNEDVKLTPQFYLATFTTPEARIHSLKSPDLLLEADKNAFASEPA